MLKSVTAIVPSYRKNKERLDASSYRSAEKVVLGEVEHTDRIKYAITGIRELVDS